MKQQLDAVDYAIIAGCMLIVFITVGVSANHLTNFVRELFQLGTLGTALTYSLSAAILCAALLAGGYLTRNHNHSQKHHVWLLGVLLIAAASIGTSLLSMNRNLTNNLYAEARNSATGQSNNRLQRVYESDLMRLIEDRNKLGADYPTAKQKYDEMIAAAEQRLLSVKAQIASADGSALASSLVDLKNNFGISKFAIAFFFAVLIDVVGHLMFSIAVDRRYSQAPRSAGNGQLAGARS